VARISVGPAQIIAARRRRACETARVRASQPSVGVVGHVEWVQFARVERVPRVGEVAHAREPFEEPAGGGAVAAVQLARLAGRAVLVTALGDDVEGARSRERLAELGVEVRAATRGEPTRRAITLLDDADERTIVTLGPRLEPLGGETKLQPLDAVYFTAGDLEALRIARAAARVLVASPRARSALGRGVRVDALVLSGEDELEREASKQARGEAALVLETEGERGGRYTTRDGASGRWEATPLPGPRADSYGCGDSFAAGLTYGLGAGMTLAEALELAARCGAACATGRGPYERQLGA
jgi:ribokinase